MPRHGGQAAPGSLIGLAPVRNPASTNKPGFCVSKVVVLFRDARFCAPAALGAAARPRRSAGAVRVPERGTRRRARDVRGHAPEELQAVIGLIDAKERRRAVGERMLVDAHGFGIFKALISRF